MQPQPPLFNGQQLLAYVPDDDGYSLPGYIAGERGLYPPFRFRFRPMKFKIRSRLFKSLEGVSPDKKLDLMAAAAAPRIPSWEHATDKGEAISVTPEAILGLQSELQDHLYSIVFGFRGSDSDPTIEGNLSKGFSNEDYPAEVLAEAAETGRSPADILAERDAKN